MTSAIASELIESTRRLLEVLEALGDEPLLAGARLVAQRVFEPRSYITVVGETSTGKSSLINGLVGWPLLPAFARPTTAVVTQVVLQPETEPRYFALVRDATMETVSRPRFLELSEHPEGELLRLQARVAPPATDFDGMHVFDTPGFNSLVEGHEEVMRDFLPQSDVIVFVAGYRTGFQQPDQDLYELVREATSEDPQMPVLLVVNRAPAGTTKSDKRVREILRNATDSIQREPDLFIVDSVDQRSAPQLAEAPLPDAGPAWRRVAALAGSPDRLEAVQAKLITLLKQVTRETEDELERRLLLLAASDEERKAHNAMMESLREAQRASLEAVEKSAAILQRSVPLALTHLCREMQGKLHREIDAAGKWLGHEDCLEWLRQHALPYEIRQAARQVERVIEEELTRLDEELRKIANTAVTGIEREARLPGVNIKRLAENLVRTLLQRVGGEAVNGALRGIGGVGGAAAGAGNLVKMLVSKTGQIFGKTFGREVYRQIGKTFTKRFLQRLNVVISVVIEVVMFVRDANRWKKQMKEKIDATLQEWEKDVRKELLEEHLPAIRERNEKGIRGIYEDLIRESDALRPVDGDETERQQLGSWRRELQSIRLALEGFPLQRTGTAT